ncbi:uncharacterized protein CEXT_140781 [Caerostris extrusa]|uniref:Uncharacterized protein n=1 Tax=Caerostris extrusa TaxID=172846 RepID=A0AAV4Q9E3_CAEEX|nr:uncharacterized protein CEXT_140781 [Caerostris extrusa]
MKFIIEPINVDMGTLYPGEELVIYARAFMEIPVKSVILEWSLGDVDFTVSKEKFLFRKIDKIGRKRPTTFETMNVRRNFKRRKKRNIDETEGFEDDEDDTANLKRYSIHSDIDKYVNKNNQDESYEDGHQQHLMYSNRLHKRNARFQNDLNQPLESLSIDNHLFYNDQDGIKSYDANYRQRNKNQYTLPKHEPFHDKDSYKMNNYASYRRNVPDQQDITNDEQNELLNDRKFDFSSRNSRFIDRQLDGPFNNKREDVSPEQLNEFTAQANRLLSENDLSNQIRDQFDESHFAEHEKYTFDDAESALIADKKTNMIAIFMQIVTKL